MIKRKSLWLVILGLAYLVITALPVSAEWFADFHVGPAFTQDNDPKTNGTELKDLEIDNSVSIGGRFGHWFDWFEAFPYLGLAIDVSHVRPDVDDQTTANGVAVASLDIETTGISFDAMLRYPLLKTSEFPNGQLQPYFTLGPGIYITHIEDSTNFTPNNQDDTDTAAGVKVGTGVAWQFHRNLALFTEYRFTHFSSDFNFGANTLTDLDINNHRVVFGASLRF